MHLPLSVGDDRHSAAGNREAPLAIRTTAATAILHSGNHGGKVDKVAAVQRKIGNALVLDHLSNGCTFGFEHRAGRNHFDRLSDTPDVQYKIDAGFLLSFELEFRHGLGAESLHFGMYGVLAYLKQGEGILAGLIRGFSETQARGHTLDGDGRP